MSIDLAKTQVVAEGKAIPKRLGPFIRMFLKRHPWSLMTFIIFILFEACLTPINAYLLKMIVNGAASTSGKANLILATLLVPAIIYVCVNLMLNVVYSLHRYAQLKFYPKIKSDIAGTMYHYLVQHSYHYFSEHFSGSLSKKIFDLLGGVESLIQIFTHNLMPRSLSVVISSIVLYLVHPFFGWMLFIWALAYVGTSYLMAEKSEKLSYALSEAGNAMSGKLVDSIVNIMSTKLFANRKYEENVVFQSINNLMAKDRALLWYLLKAYSIQGIWIATLLAAMLTGLIYGRLHELVTVGDFALIITIAFSISGDIFNMGEQILRFSKEVGNCRQALNIIVEPHEIDDLPNATALKVTQGQIVFDNVQFQYPNAEALFENKTVTILSGQKVGLVGHSGGGKTTFVNLILRLFDVNQGRILIDSQDIKRVTQDSLRENIGMIPQDPSLFHRSLHENIQFGRLDSTNEEVIEAAKRAHAHEFIVSLSKGYDALVGERGVKLSGGQRQRIAIARAFLKNAPILILDEATSQLDSITEKYIQESLWELMQNKTTIVIAHRLSTLLHMDRILVFDKGKIVEDGTHQELLAKKGLYSELWQSQVGGFLLDTDDGILI
ncbi:MAG: ABC transporter ATP-binding protein [Candidatus Babeliales bacterium]|uniref:ABC transporter ATP-binding protein/permease n=1 Tax=Candidatus Berkiella aquae TaxID=295108 RepID=A0A0Q9YAH0_9GAMM|nr:ABC transporter ATP-binding protein [Candidatus Berkiella aquae]MCS5712836.1 ABC transporter ATP-binding protein/permease [Candidatus Berkiella aquae]